MDFNLYSYQVPFNYSPKNVWLFFPTSENALALASQKKRRYLISISGSEEALHLKNLK